MNRNDSELELVKKALAKHFGIRVHEADSDALSGDKAVMAWRLKKENYNIYCCSPGAGAEFEWCIVRLHGYFGTWDRQTYGCTSEVQGEFPRFIDVWKTNGEVGGHGWRSESWRIPID